MKHTKYFKAEFLIEIVLTGSVYFSSIQIKYQMVLTICHLNCVQDMYVVHITRDMDTREIIDKINFVVYKVNLWNKINRMTFNI